MQTCNLYVTARKHRTLSSVFISFLFSASPLPLWDLPLGVSSLGHCEDGHTLDSHALTMLVRLTNISDLGNNRGHSQ